MLLYEPVENQTVTLGLRQTFGCAKPASCPVAILLMLQLHSALICLFLIGLFAHNASRVTDSHGNLAVVCL